ncbi:hypothetical protein E4U55_002847 [Claviceps digitariae]|nr:hypothetical protein E4U55_002847 [Claviceps digitariae]
MGHKWKRYRSSPVVDTGIDLLSTAFGLPSHWDIKRADRKFKDRVVYEYEDDSDESTDSMLESDTNDAYIPQETSPSRRSPAPRSKRSIVNSSRKRQQSHRHTASSIEKQRNVLCKGKGESLSVNGKVKEQNSKQRRCRSRETNKTPKPTTPGSCCPPRLAKSPSVPKNDDRIYKTIYQHPLTVKPVGQFIQQTSSIPLQFAPVEAHAVVLPPIPQHPENSGYRFAYHYATPVTNEQSKQMHSSPVPNSKAHKLLGLQQHLNNVQERLANEPGNPRLQRDQREAQEQLNKFMDVLVADKSQGNIYNSSTTVTGKDLSSRREFSLGDDAKENVAPNGGSTKPETGSPLPPQKQANPTLRLAVLRSAGTSNTLRHHLCSGCGEVRSQPFHESNPISAARSHKPILNYCSACRETRFKKNMMDIHHFCFGCGKVRSKLFQEKYKPKPGEPLLPNYCGNCTNQARLMEDNNDASILGEVIREPSMKEDRKADGVAASDSLSVSSKCGNSSPRQTIQTLKSSGKAKGIAKLRLSNKSPIKSTASPVSPAESSPFYPGRRLGSAQRRAQRGSTPHPAEEHVTASESLTGNHHDYRVPYVEELSSETEHSEAVFKGASVETLDRDAKSTYRGETHLEESFEENVAKNAQYHASRETVRSCLGKSRISSVASSISSEEQTLKHGDQCREAGYDDLGFGSEQAQSTFSHSDSDIEQQYTHSTGAFGKGSKHLGEARFAEETDGGMNRRRSPLADFERPTYASYIHEDDCGGNSQQDCHYTEQPEIGHFSSSRGAFGRKESYFSMFDYNSTSSGNAGSTNSLNLDRSNGHDTTARSHYPEQADERSKSSSSDQGNSGNSSFSSNSSTGKAQTNNDRPAMRSTYSRSVFTDFSRSTNNPYYTPRRPTYPSSSEGAFHRSWDWSKRHQPPTMSRANRSTSFDDRIPEPIVEEPASAPPSPVQRTKLLEFKTLDDRDLDLPPVRNDGISRNEIDGNGPVSRVCDPQTPVPKKRTVLR